MQRLIKGLLIITGVFLAAAALYLLITQSSRIGSDALLGLISAIIGALIVTSTHSWISFLDRRNQLRLAALERKLETHQQAFTLWRKLLFNVHNQNAIGNVVMECQDWWERNCLYLDPKAREAFFRAYISALNQYGVLQTKDANLISKNWEDILSAGKAIVSGVALPTLGESESKVKNKDGSDVVFN